MTAPESTIRDWLSPEEPDYHAAARALGQASTSALVALTTDADPHFVARVVSLAGAIGGACAQAVAVATVSHDAATVRTQVAAVARRLTGESTADIVLPLLRDDDVNVRKFAIAAGASIRGSNAGAVRAALERLRHHDPEPGLRARAARMLGTP